MEQAIAWMFEEYSRNFRDVLKIENGHRNSGFSH
jgi:hypothetical protein